MEIEKHPLKPFLPAKAKLLMLGSFPPQKKRWSMDFYYPNLNNDMWRIFGILFFDDKDYFLNETRKVFCRERIIDFLNEKDRQPPALPEGTVRRRYSIEGQVLGVGFRYRARYAAQTLELTGWVENEDDGSVTLEVQGDPEKFLRLFAMIQKSDYIRITGIRQKDLPPDPWERGFSVKGY